MTKTKDRITAVILTLIMLLSTTVSVSSAATDMNEVEDKAEDFFIHLGTADKIQYERDKTVSRSEFAAIMSNICRITTDSATKPTEDLDDFSDVLPDNPYYNEIRAMLQYGYMNGISQTQFGSDQDTVLVQGVKVIADMLGYKVAVAQKGGYPSGYQDVAVELGLTDGIDKGFFDCITQHDFARLIYNSLNVPLLKGDINENKWSADEDNTFLSAVLKLDEVKGIVTDNGITGLYAQTQISASQVKIDNDVYQLADDASYAGNYLGRNVTAYISSDNNGDNTLVYAFINGKDTAVSFDIADFVNYDTTNISYSSGSRTVSRRLSGNAVMICNNSVMEYFDKSTFDFERGTVTLISSTSDVDIILLESHEYIYTEKVDYNNKIIYSKLLNTDRIGTKYDMNDYDFVKITDSENKAVELKDITAGEVLDIKKGGKAISIVVKKDTVESFTVKNKYEEGNRTYITDGQTTYSVSGGYLASPYTTKIETGKTYKLFLGGSDYVVWAETGAVSTSARSGYMLYAYENEDGITYFMKIYTTDGVGQVLQLCERVKVLTEGGDTVSVKAQAAYERYLKSYSGYCKIKINDDNLINYIELPTSEPNTHGQIYKLYDRRTETIAKTWTGDEGYNGKWFYDDNTVFMNAPSDVRDINGYSMITKKSAIEKWERKNQRVVAAYAEKPNAAVASFVMFLPNEKSEESVVGTSKMFMVVEKVDDVWKDDENVKRITGTTNTSSLVERIELYSKPDAIKESDGTAHSAFENIKDTMMSKDENGNVKRYDVQKGDIIRCLYDDNDKFVTVADLTWRMTADNPTSPNGKKGWLLGSNGYHREGFNNGNPYGINASGGLEDYKADFSGSMAYRCGYGSVIKTEGKSIYQVTAADLSAPEATLDNISSDFGRWNIYIYNPILMNIDEDGKVTTRPGSIKDVKTFEEAGHDCSRILYASYWGVYTIGVIINGGSY